MNTLNLFKLGTLFAFSTLSFTAFSKPCVPILKGVLDSESSKQWCVLKVLDQDFNKDGSIDHVFVLEKNSTMSEQRAFTQQGIPTGDFQQSTPRSLVVVLSDHGKKPSKIDRNDYFLLRREEAGINYNVEVELVKVKHGFSINQTIGQMILSHTFQLTPKHNWQLTQSFSRSIDDGLIAVETKQYLKGISVVKTGKTYQGKWTKKITHFSKKPIYIEDIR